MVFLLSKSHEPGLEKYLTNYQYTKTGEGKYVRQKYTDRSYPIYKLVVNHDNMDHNLLFTLTLETAPEHRQIKEEMIVFHKGTVIQEELARITRQFI